MWNIRIFCCIFFTSLSWFATCKSVIRASVEFAPRYALTSLTSALSDFACVMVSELFMLMLLKHSFAMWPICMKTTSNWTWIVTTEWCWWETVCQRTRGVGNWGRLWWGYGRGREGWWERKGVLYWVGGYGLIIGLNVNYGFLIVEVLFEYYRSTIGGAWEGALMIEDDAKVRRRCCGLRMVMKIICKLLCGNDIKF